MSNQPAPRSDNSAAKKQQMGAGTIGLIVALAALLLFILQNRDSVDVEFLTVDLNMPLWLLIVISALLGAIIARLAGWLIARSKSHSE